MIYPDLSNDKFDIKYSKRLILSSDLIKTRPIGTERFTGGYAQNVTEGGTGSAFPESDPNFPDQPSGGCGCLGIPDDEEYYVPADTEGSNTNSMLHGGSVFYFTSFKNYGIRLFRNRLPQTEAIDFIWNAVENKLELSIPSEFEENFILQGYKIEIPEPEEYTVVVGGGNINNFEDGNSIIFLTTFTNVRIRVTRNNIIQSSITEYNWDSGLAKLTLTIPPVEEEEFKIEGY